MMKMKTKKRMPEPHFCQSCCRQYLSHCPRRRKTMPSRGRFAMVPPRPPTLSPHQQRDSIRIHPPYRSSIPCPSRHFDCWRDDARGDADVGGADARQLRGDPVQDHVACCDTVPIVPLQTWRHRDPPQLRFSPSCDARQARLPAPSFHAPPSLPFAVASCQFPPAWQVPKGMVTDPMSRLKMMDHQHCHC